MKTIRTWILVLAAVTLAACQSRQTRWLETAECLALSDPDSAAQLLAEVDTTRLDEGEQALHTLVRVLVLEEQMERATLDSLCFLIADSGVWEFRRVTTYRHSYEEFVKSHAPGLTDSLLTRAYHYYNEQSLGGTGDDDEAVRRFGRLCFAIHHHYPHDDAALPADKLFHLATYCLDRVGDHEAACRAYLCFGQDFENNHSLCHTEQHWCFRRAFEHLRQHPAHPLWLLTLLNDYGRVTLQKSPYNLQSFPTLVRACHIAADDVQKGTTEAADCDQVFLCLDSIWSLPYEPFQVGARYESYAYGNKKMGLTYHCDVGVPIDMYEEAHTLAHSDNWLGHDYEGQDFENEWKQVEQRMESDTNTYLAAGYVMKAAQLERRLLSAALLILILFVAVLALAFWLWRNRWAQRRTAEQTQHRLEAERMAAQLRQKDTMIAALRGHIIDKSEILEMLSPTEGRRTVINARNWREIEMTLNTADGDFVSRLRAEHPDFTEEDIRLCMLTRLRLSNQALAAIYLITVSAVQHRKQKLKREGFGCTDSAVTLDQIINQY